MKEIKSKNKIRAKKIKKEVLEGRIYIQATFNNTIVTVTDKNGNVISWASAGTAGFKGTRKSTPYAASIITKQAIEKAKNYGLEKAEVYVKGVGAGREFAIRAIEAAGVKVISLQDRTPIPHNGCRPKKVRHP